MSEENFKNLIGVKLDVKMLKSTIQIGDTIKEVSYLKLDEEVALKKIGLSGRKVRFIMPGYMYTQEYCFGRINIRINNEGIIEEVSLG